MSDQTAPAEPEPVEVVEFGLFWPEGDPGELRSAAQLWNGMADSLDLIAIRLGGEVDGVAGANSGAAVDSFVAFWGAADSAITGTADQCRQLASSLEEFADAIDDVRREITQLAIEIAASIAIGVGLAFFTAGLSAGAAAATTAHIIATAARLGVTLGLRAATIAGRVIVISAAAAGESAAANVIAQTGSAAVFDENHNPLAGFSVGEVFTSAAGGAVVAAPIAGVGARRFLDAADVAHRGPAYQRLAQNQRIGAIGEDVSVRAIQREGGEALGRQVTVQTPGGHRPRTDILYRDANGNLRFREVKTGDARLSDNQRLGYPEIRNQGGEVRSDLPDAGIPRGTQLGPTPVDEVRYPR